MAGISFWGRFATRMAELFVPPFYGRHSLALSNRKGYISPRASLYGGDLKFGPNIFIDDSVLIFQGWKGGPIKLGEKVHIHRGTIIQTGLGGAVKIGTHTHIQAGCQFSAYQSKIQIGNDVQIAPHCAFFSYNHGFAPGELIRKQPLTSKGDILVEDDVWLAVGVKVLDGVRIGEGAVIGAGSVVTNDIPPGAIAAGVPAKVIKFRKDLEK